jgi:WhiB family transcriptional regulator, redox-sensing transcriptional regulator
MAELSRLPIPLSDVYEWQYQGACREADPALFFHPEGERGPSRRNRDQAAVAICAGCPVIEQCRQHGLSVQEPYGVWGGLTEDDREAIYTAQRRTERQSRTIRVA